MLNKILLVIALGLFSGLTLAEAQPAAPTPARVKGQIIAARVQGHVVAISKTDNSSRDLHDGDKVTDQTTVVTSPGASVILVFSNGATVDVAADSNLDIELFEQDPFSSDIKMADLKQETGTSTTKMNLTKGELVGKVVHLNVDKGSEFTVQTPVGAAGIRGTTFRIVFRPGRDGKAFFVITTADGTVVFRGTTSGPISVPAGKQVVATFNYTAPSGNSTGTTPAATPTATVTTSDTSPAEESQITTVVQQFLGATTPVVFPTGGGATPNGTGSGTNTPPPAPNNTPSDPAAPLPATTSGAGTG
jgi:FecR protein